MEKNTNSRLYSGRRSVLKTLGASAAAVTLTGETIASSQRPPEPQQRKFDPIWYSATQDSWKGVTYDTSNETRRGGMLLRRIIYLNEIRPGDYDNMFSFNMCSFGLAATDGDPGSDLPDEIGPIQVMHSKHTMGVESEELDVGSIGTNYPRIAASRADDGDIITEIPDRSSWTTGKDDMERADVDVPDGTLPTVLGGAGIATGLAAGVPTLGVGTAVFLTGTSAALGIGSLLSSMDDERDSEKQDKDQWEYVLKETTGSILPSRKNVAAFMHNVTIDVPVPHGKSGELRVYDRIEANQDGLAVPYQDEAAWVENHKGDDWHIYVPSYDKNDDPEQNPPRPRYNSIRNL